MNLTDLDKKVLAIAAQVCWRNGAEAGDRICQDWLGDTSAIDALTDDERDALQYEFEQYNSGGEDFEPGYFPYDEMVISFYTAHWLEKILEEETGVE